MGSGIFVSLADRGRESNTPNERIEIRIDDLDVSDCYPKRTAWVRPKIVTTVLDEGSYYREIVKKGSSVYRIQMDECTGADDSFCVHIDELVASCPCCSVGADQTLISENWIGIFDWSPAKTSWFDTWLENEPDQTSHEAAMEKFNKIFFDLFDACDGLGEASSTMPPANAYGVNLGELPYLNPNQMSLNLPGVPQGKRSVSGMPELTGVYRCPFCGSSFAVSLCKDDNAVESKRERRIREAMLWHLDYGFDPLANLKRFGVRIVQTNSDVSVLCNIDGIEHSVVFELTTGMTRIDGCSLAKEALRCHPIFCSGVFASAVLVRRLAEILSMSYTKLPGISDTYNFLTLIAANRFIDYPASFYQRLVWDEDFLFRMSDKASVIPRHHDELRALFERTGLPNKKSIKRRLFNDPFLFCQIVMGPDIPFRNTDIICQFLDLPRNHPLFQSLLGGRRSNYCELGGEALSLGLRVIGSVKGEVETFKWFSSFTQEELDWLIKTIDEGYWLNTGRVREQIAATPLKQLGKLLHFLSYEKDHSFVEIDRPYAYPENQRRLEGRFRGFEFRLPNTPKDLVEASFDLHNCLDGYALRLRVFDELVVLIAKSNRYVGAIGLDDENRVLQAYSACNYDLDAVEGLQDAFDDWCESRGVRTGERHELAA